MQSLKSDDMFVYAWVLDKNNIVAVPFYYTLDYEKTSQEFKNAFETYQAYTYEMLKNTKNLILVFKVKIADLKLKKMEAKEGIQRINLTKIQEQSKTNEKEN